MTWQLARQLILDDVGRFGHGAELDSDAEFARRAGVSIPTIKRAMADLARRGLVVRRQGQRTIAAKRPTVVSGTELSFRHTAEANNQKLVTRLLEKSCRVPQRTPETDFEQRAHSALGLKRGQPFIVIARLRILDGSPRVIHRSYLNPSHYSRQFLTAHDFERESLFEIIESYGLRLHSRDTRIRAAFPTESDAALLEAEHEAVLNVDQQLYAMSSYTNRIVTAEYLRATYARWEYVISDRR